MAQISVVLGGQWGDEGKGKLIDMLSEKFDIIVRATGGANAGHSVYLDFEGQEKKFIFHLIPSGVMYENTHGVIGNGCVIHLQTLFKEIQDLKDAGIMLEGRLFISDRAHVVFEYHKEIDGIQEENRSKGGVGTTRRGIGPCYTDKIGRYGIRMYELFSFESFEEKYRAHIARLQKEYSFTCAYDIERELFDIKEYLPFLKDMVRDTAFYLDTQRSLGKRILFEGANGALLDIDHGTYPFVTSSNPTIGGIATGTGFPSRFIQETIGVMKSYMTRVGGGPFPTELHGSLAHTIREQGCEYGSTTGRPRRCGWFDVVASRYSCMINGFTSLNLTKLDVLSGLSEIFVGVSYTLHGKKLDSFPASLIDLEKCEVQYEHFDGWSEDISAVRYFGDLPQSCQRYVLFIEKMLGCPIKYIGVGKQRGAMISQE